MKDCFYENLDTNFINACKMVQGNYSHTELINFLKTGNLTQKQFAALTLEDIYSQEEFELFLSHLTGCDGKIREAVAFKLLSFLKSTINIKTYFNNENCPSLVNILANATIDINANICRSVIESVMLLKDIPDFSSRYIENISNYINDTFNSLDKFIYKDKKYVINKQLFKLYWLLEALKIFAQNINEEKLLQILTKASKINEYTIREQVAKIVILLSSPIFNGLKTSLSQDTNYYVKTIFK